MIPLHKYDAPAFPSTPTDRSGQIAASYEGAGKGEIIAAQVLASLVAGEPWTSFVKDDSTSGHTAKATCAAAAKAAVNLAEALLEEFAAKEVAS